MLIPKNKMLKLAVLSLSVINILQIVLVIVTNRIRRWKQRNVHFFGITTSTLPKLLIEVAALHGAYSCSVSRSVLGSQQFIS